MKHGVKRGAAIFCHQGLYRSYKNPKRMIEAFRVEEAPAALTEIEREVASGAHAAGYVAYEAAPAFDAAFKCHPPCDYPLVSFGIYDAFESAQPEACEEAFEIGEWQAALAKEDYLRAIEKIRDHIAAGDSYQINFTFPMHAAFSGAAYAWFQALCAAQGQGYFAYYDRGPQAVISASPELFFQLDGENLITRPMKGTRPRGADREADQAQRHDLAQSEKDRAENIMIVDLLRNDVGRISRQGSVQVPQRFQIEAYPTVWQMTSTVSAKSTASVSEIFQALFPCGSVTGAPKVESMRIIHALEKEARGVYCGAVGWWAPQRQACFNVAIRTALVDREAGEATYPVGSGVTWYSSPEGEYEECLDKAAILNKDRKPFQLLESLLLTQDGYWLEAGHLDRLCRSADYFGIPVDRPAIQEALHAYAKEVKVLPAKVRLRYAASGSLYLEDAPIRPLKDWRVALAKKPVSSKEVFLAHKTTAREVYERARQGCEDCDDVLLWNENGEVTESTIANLVVEIDGVRYTPPLNCGLLPGVFRQTLIDEGKLRERVITKELLAQADSISLINSVRGWITVKIDALT